MPKRPSVGLQLERRRGGWHARLFAGVVHCREKNFFSCLLGLSLTHAAVVAPTNLVERDSLAVAVLLQRADGDWR